MKKKMIKKKIGLLSIGLFVNASLISGIVSLEKISNNNNLLEQKNIGYFSKENKSLGFQNEIYPNYSENKKKINDLIKQTGEIILRKRTLFENKKIDFENRLKKLKKQNKNRKIWSKIQNYKDFLKRIKEKQNQLSLFTNLFIDYKYKNQNIQISIEETILDIQKYNKTNLTYDEKFRKMIVQVRIQTNKKQVQILMDDLQNLLEDLNLINISYKKENNEIYPKYNNYDKAVSRWIDKIHFNLLYLLNKMEKDKEFTLKKLHDLENQNKNSSDSSNSTAKSKIKSEIDKSKKHLEDLEEMEQNIDNFINNFKDLKNKNSILKESIRKTTEEIRKNNKSLVIEAHVKANKFQMSKLKKLFKSLFEDTVSNDIANNVI